MMNGQKNITLLVIVLTSKAEGYGMWVSQLWFFLILLWEFP